MDKYISYVIGKIEFTYSDELNEKMRKEDFENELLSLMNTEEYPLNVTNKIEDGKYNFTAIGEYNFENNILNLCDVDGEDYKKVYERHIRIDGKVNIEFTYSEHIPYLSLITEKAIKSNVEIIRNDGEFKEVINSDLEYKYIFDHPIASIFTSYMENNKDKISSHILNKLGLDYNISNSDFARNSYFLIWNYLIEIIKSNSDDKKDKLMNNLMISQLRKLKEEKKISYIILFRKVLNNILEKFDIWNKKGLYKDINLINKSDIKDNVMDVMNMMKEKLDVFGNNIEDIFSSEDDIESDEKE